MFFKLIMWKERGWNKWLTRRETEWQGYGEPTIDVDYVREDASRNNDCSQW